MTRKQYEARRAARIRQTLEALRQPSRYWIRDVERDLKPRTLRTIYAENKAGRRVPLSENGNVPLKGIVAIWPAHMEATA